jgi:hypothetical protein
MIQVKKKDAEAFCLSLEVMLDHLYEHFDIEPTSEVLGDLLTNLGHETKKRALTSSLSLYISLGIENALIAEASMEEAIAKFNLIASVFSSIPTWLAVRIYLEDGRLKIKS